MTKICADCKRELPLECFTKNKTRKDGLQHCCRQCKNIRRRRHYVRHKHDEYLRTRELRKAVTTWFQELKATYTCARCPENHPACIQFHHIKDDKLCDVSTLVTHHSRRLILEEISKCIPLCANCHAKEHWQTKTAHSSNG